MNFLVAAFVIYMNDEVRILYDLNVFLNYFLKDAFWTIASILQNYKLKVYYINPGNVRKALKIFDSLLEKFLPKIK